MNPLTRLQLEHNRESAAGWEAFAAHREKVTDLLAGGSAPEPSRLCVLGAGNCNDLDLPALLRPHREVHLVDLDAEALARGVARQGLADSPAVHRHGGMDVTGVLDALAGWAPPAAISPADLAACALEPLRRVAPALPGPFDVVASTCLLSQLILAVVHAVGERHPRFLELLQAVRAGHLRLLANLIAPGGAGVLITDVVSSDTFPALGSVAEETFPGVLAQLIRERNFFHGVNPSVLVSLFRTDPVLAREVAGLEPLRPWRWDLGPRLYAVCALKLRKAGLPGPPR
jgi:hypothetical protein